MNYDDDTGRRVHYEIRSEDRPSGRTQQTQLPSQEIQEEISGLGQQSGWEAERICAYLRRKYGRHDISVATIRYVLAQARAGWP